MASGESAFGDVELALEEVNVPSYVIDRFGVIRWLNAAARALVGDVRGRQFTSVIAPEDTQRARELFTRKIFGKDGATEATATLISHHGGHVECEVNGVPLRDGNKIVGVWGLITQQEPVTKPDVSHPALTPRQAQILHLLADGHSTHQIASELYVAVPTVRNHVRRLLRALDAHSRLEAIASARRSGLLTA
jgi:PAS domain S-box-containing protein